MLMMIKVKILVLIKLSYTSYLIIEPKILIVLEHEVQHLLSTCLVGPIITTYYSNAGVQIIVVLELGLSTLVCAWQTLKYSNPCH